MSTAAPAAPLETAAGRTFPAICCVLLTGSRAAFLCRARTILSFVFFTALLSCSTRSPAPSPGVEGEAPIRAEVVQAFFVGANLHVTVQLFAKTAVDTKQLLVQLIGLKQGQIVETAQADGNQAAGGEELDAGESLLFRLAVPAAELTEYQIRVNWGDEAVQAMRRASLPSAGSAAESSGIDQTFRGGKKIEADETAEQTDGTSPAAESRSGERSPVPGSEPLEITGNELEEEAVRCETPPCDKRFAIRAELRNSGALPISGIKLAVGIYFSVPGELPKTRSAHEPVGDGEELVDLQGVELPPGATKRLRIAVARSVPVVPGGSFLPYVRIIEYQPPPAR